MTSDTERVAAAIVAGADAHLDNLIASAERGNKQAAADLSGHIRAQIEYGLPLDDRLASYVTRHGISKQGKTAGDNKERDIAMAFAVALRIKEFGEQRQQAIQAVADLAGRSFKATERAYAGELRRAADTWASDLERRPTVIAIAEPYLKRSGAI